MTRENLRNLAILLGVCFFSVSCQQTSKQKQLNEKTYTEHFIHGQTVKLHYLDWGGSGEPLILIHGLGDSPFLFEELANSLKIHFRVIAYSKRGHCKSETSDSSYDNSTLVSDLKLLLDSLQIPKANLLGWSMGGNEITEFAIQYPERTNKLIYFEAGYDLSEEPFKVMLNAISKSAFANSADLTSVNAYKKWYHDFWFPDVEWNSTLESNLQVSIQINPDSSIRAIPNDTVSKVILQSAMNYHRHYDKVLAPALMLYTNSFFVAARNDSVTSAIYDNLEKEIINPWRQSSMNRIKNEMKNATIKIISKGSHVSFIFLSKDEIVQSIDSFLLTQTTSQNMNVTENTLKQILDAFNRHDLDAIMEFFSDDCSFDFPRGPESYGQRFIGKAQVREALAGRFKGIPDVHYGEDSHWISAEGDRGVSEWTLTGTTTSGISVKVRGCDLWEFRNGKVTRKNSYWKIVEPITK